MWGWEVSQSFADKPSRVHPSIFWSSIWQDDKVLSKTFLELLTPTLSRQKADALLSLQTNTHLSLGTKMSFTLLRILHNSCDAWNFLTLISMLFHPSHFSSFLWLPVQPLPHSRVALQAEKPRGHLGGDATSAELHLAVTSTPGYPRWHSHKNSMGFPRSKQEQGMVSWDTHVS